MRPPRPYERNPLPESRNTDGRPVWEAPIIDLAFLMDQEDIDKERKALLKHYKGDVAKTSKFFDLHDEICLLAEYWDWINDNRQEAEKSGDKQGGDFFVRMDFAVWHEYEEVNVERKALGIKLVRSKDGSYTVQPWLTSPTPSDGLAASVEQSAKASGSQHTALPCHPEESDWVSTDFSASVSLREHSGSQAEAALDQTSPTNCTATAEVIETTPLLLKATTVDGDETKTLLSTILCGCPCS